LLCKIGALYLSYRAFKAKQSGVSVIVVALVLHFILFSWFMLIVVGIASNYSLSYEYTLMDILYNTAIFLVPISFSIYLSTKFARVSKDIEKKLEEVQQLSTEKQNYLATQNETLEKQVTERTEALTQTLTDLKKAQAQLIQIETQQALNQERSRIARDMHDDISSGLSAINLLANYIQNTPLSKNIETEIKHIAQSSTDINQRIREIIWSVSSDADNLTSLADFIKRYVADFSEMHHIPCNFQANEPFPDVKLSSDSRRNLFLCVKEALNNAAKYANATLVEVSITYERGELILSVKDNGQGFNIENALKNGGNGLKNIKERMKQIGGEAIFVNERGCQMVLSCTFKI
jgi:two-component system, NarL family, sensor histidine kinase DesK